MSAWWWVLLVVGAVLLVGALLAVAVTLVCLDDGDDDPFGETGDDFVPLRRLKFASDCRPCPDCDEPWCDDCEAHYAECNCIGPHSEED